VVLAELLAEAVLLRLFGVRPLKKAALYWLV